RNHRPPHRHPRKPGADDALSADAFRSTASPWIPVRKKEALMKTLDSFLAKAVIGLVFLLVNIISIYLLLRGHNLPGGGFIGGLTMGMSFVLLGLIRGWTQLQRELPVPPLRVAGAGLLIAILSGIGPMFAGKPFLTQYNLH